MKPGKPGKTPDPPPQFLMRDHGGGRIQAGATIFSGTVIPSKPSSPVAKERDIKFFLTIMAIAEFHFASGKIPH